MLAFVVLYNLNNININERKKELATLKCWASLTERPPLAYSGKCPPYRFWLHSGVVLGSALHRYVITTVEIESYVWPDHQDSAVTLAIALTFGFFSGQSSVDAFQAEKDRHGRITEECGIKTASVDNFPGKKIRKVDKREAEDQ